MYVLWYLTVRWATVAHLRIERYFRADDWLQVVPIDLGRQIDRFSPAPVFC